MANYAEGVNPNILRWARERAGYTIDEIAEAFKKDPAEIASWEVGESVPTYNQLERLAYTFYKRPIALFFFPAPPDEPSPDEAFRTLPDFEIRKLQPDTRHALREAQAMQIALRELTDGQNPASRRIFDDIELLPTADITHSAKTVRDYLGIPFSEQISWIRIEDALRQWRTAVQDVGIFVFKRSFKQRDVSGFCLTDREFPLIYLNNSTAKTRQIFSIFHELAHILLNTSGVTKTDDSFIRILDSDERAIEVFCNRFAAEFLVPQEEFERVFDPALPVEVTCSSLSAHFSVSREVILRKLLDLGQISDKDYESMTAVWNEEFLESRATGTGGNYYATQAAYLGNKYMNLAFGRYYEGRLNIGELATYLNVKAKSIEGLERHYLRRTSS